MPLGLVISVKQIRAQEKTQPVLLAVVAVAVAVAEAELAVRKLAAPVGRWED